MEREKSSFVLGIVLLAVGIVILTFVLMAVLGLVANTGPYLQDQIGSGSSAPPRPFFAWSSTDLDATFQDLSSAGSVAITTHTWDFGDGETSTTRDPPHTYGSDGDYFVRLTVRDADGREAVTAARINVASGSTNGGTAETMPGDLDFGSITLPIAVALLVFGLYVVAFLVGGSLVKAGWNLIRPRPETIRIRLKPQQFEQFATAEVVPPAPPAPLTPAAPAAPAAEVAPPVVPAPPPPES